MGNDYRSTMNLPKTDFAMRANLAENEPKRLKKWADEDLYHRILERNRDGEPFVLHDGPPYANGPIHIGHAFNKILKDFVVKSHAQRGYFTPYVPGWDCHGQPIEHEVEKKLGTEKMSQLPQATVRRLCREWAEKFVDVQREGFKRLGVNGEWDRPYLTFQPTFESANVEVFKKMYLSGAVYRGRKPIHWCKRCHTALAEAEIEYGMETSPSIYVAFKLDNIPQVFADAGVDLARAYVLIWTTTPWTLPANTAVSFGPDIDYCFVETNGAFMLFAREMVDQVAEAVGWDSYRIVEADGESVTMKGDAFGGITYKTPILDEVEGRIIWGTHVTLESGTGAVHTAPGHGVDDYKVCERFGVPMIMPVDDDGRFMDIVPEFAGMDTDEANPRIIEWLRARGTLVGFKEIEHSYPHCWRCHEPVIFRATDQWFVSMDETGLRERALEEIHENVRWVPEWGQNRIGAMVADRPDWCISRQRTWGVPMSLFVHKDTEELHPRTLELMEEVAKRVEVDGIQAWWDLDAKEILGDEADQYVKVPDTLDVWFDSGSTHSSVVDVRPEFAGHAADMYLEGSDQHRGWFMSSLMISTAMKGKAPYRQVMTHGFNGDGQGRKMSKSIGNTVSPQDVMNKLGADILRLWVASTDYTGEMAVSDEILKRAADSYRRIRNTARFLLANLNGFDPAKDMVKPEEMVVLDRWAVGCAKAAQEDILKAYEAYDFHEVVQRLMRFCSVEMGSFYLDIIKDRQYTAKADSVARRSCQTALYHIAEALVRWMAPILSFTADEVWGYLPGEREKYVFTGEWYEGLFGLADSEAMNDAFWDELLKVRGEVNKVIEQARADKKVGGSLEAAVTLYAEPELSAKLTALGDELRFVLLTSGATVADYNDAPADAQQSEVLKGLKVALSKAEGEKCPRCWHYTRDVGKVAEHAEICGRCVSNVAGDGEKRKFA